MTPEDLPKRMAGRIEIDANGCWLWTLSVTSAGYGNAWDGTTVRTAHSLAYETLVGPVPDGLVLDHLCMVQRCCNPEHLDPVTQAENVRRWRAWAIASGTWTPMKPREECPEHGARFMRDYKDARATRGLARVCRECVNERQRRNRAARRARAH